MTQQYALNFPASYVGKEAWLSQLDTVRSAVKHLGPKEVAWELNVSPQQLSDSLNERERKFWHAEWTHVIKAMLGARRDETAGELLRALLEADVVTTNFSIEEPVDISADDVSHGWRNASRAQQQAIARILGKSKDGGRR